MKIAIVGTSINLTENEERDMRQYISIVLKKYDTNQDVIITGGSKGVDTISLEVAKGLGFKVILYNPEREEWKFYKKRNLKIAKECDELYCFSVPVHTKKCYHHEELMKHEKTAGCWTAGKAFEMDKQCQLIIIPNRSVK